MSKTPRRRGVVGPSHHRRAELLTAIDPVTMLHTVGSDMAHLPQV